MPTHAFVLHIGFVKACNYVPNQNEAFIKPVQGLKEAGVCDRW